MKTGYDTYFGAVLESFLDTLGVENDGPGHYPVLGLDFERTVRAVDVLGEFRDCSRKKTAGLLLGEGGFDVIPLRRSVGC